LENQHYDANFIEIRRDVLAANAKAVVDAVKVPVIGVLKFDGYFIGITEAAKAWQAAGVTMFAVSESWEALALRREGFTEDILLMAPVADEKTLQELVAANIVLTVGGLENAGFYQKFGAKRVHVKVDTGMGRFGVDYRDEKQIREIYDVEGLEFEGIYSHFAKAYEKEYKLCKKQMERFEKVLKMLSDAGVAVGVRHIASSAAALRFPQTWMDAVRVGSALVDGLLCGVPVKLQKAHVCHARVMAVKELQPGDTLGYGSVCKAKRPTKTVVVAVGQETGLGWTGAPEPVPLLDFLVYLYHLLLRYRRPTPVTFGGKTLPMIGRIGTQYTQYDATGVDVKPGDFVQVRIPLISCTAKRIYK
jgi:alanine racemase